MLQCQEIKDKKTWDDFVTSQPNHTFLHSWAWGEFNEAMGDKIWRLGVYKKIGSKSGHAQILPKSKIWPQNLASSIFDAGYLMVGSSLIIKIHARRGNFLFIPHGPLGDREALLVLINKAKELAKREKTNFIRVSPLLEDTAENRKVFRELSFSARGGPASGWRPAPIHMHAETTWTLDLTPNEDELLMGMRKTTRNLIRRAMKDGVEVKSGTREDDIEIFNNLYKETVKKHNFTPFSLEYLRSQIQTFAKSDAVTVFTAYYQNEPLASAIIVFYGNSAFYHHGASIQSKIPAAYLLQWEAIREAKRRGHRLYNFWGIIKDDAPTRHPWQGITLFKKGFGGFQTDYLRAQDLPLSWKYWPSYIFETIRRRRRGL